MAGVEPTQRRILETRGVYGKLPDLLSLDYKSMDGGLLERMTLSMFPLFAFSSGARRIEQILLMHY